jgi:hypothetical protein
MISKRYGVERRLEQEFSLFYWILVPAVVSEVRRNFCHPGTKLLVPILFLPCPHAAKNANKFLKSAYPGKVSRRRAKIVTSLLIIPSVLAFRLLFFSPIEKFALVRMAASRYKV